MYSLKYCHAFKAYDLSKEHVIKKIRIASVFLKNEAFVVDINDDVWHILNNVPTKLEELCKKGVKQFEYCYSTNGDVIGYFAIVLLENGDLYGWGKDDYSLISEKKENDFYKLRKKEFKEHPKFDIIDKQIKFDRIAIGQRHCMGITKGNRLILWGDNGYGQLGTDTSDETKPFKVIEVERVKKFESFDELTPIESNSIELQTENIHEFTITAPYVNVLPPRTEHITKNIIKRQIQSKDRCSCYCCCENLICIICFGYCCGFFYRDSLFKKVEFIDFQTEVTEEVHVVIKEPKLFQLPVPNFEKLKQVSDIVGDDGHKIKQIGCGSYHSLVLLKCGDLYGFGCNSSGQLGIIPETSRKIPTIILKDIEQFVTTGLHTLALKFDRTLFAMGDNSYSQLGSLKPSNSNIPIEISMKFVEITTINGLSLGKGMNGNIYCWGYWGSESAKLELDLNSKEESKKENDENIPSTSSNSSEEKSDKSDVKKKSEKSSANAVISSPQRVYCKTFAEIVAKRFSITHYTIRGDDFDEPKPEKPYLIEPGLVSVLKDDAEIEAENLVKRVKNNNFEIDVLKSRVEVVERRPNITVENISGDKVTSSLISGLVVTSGSTFNISDVDISGKSK